VRLSFTDGINETTAFFTDVIGCTHAMSFGPFSDDKGTFMKDVVNVNPRAVIDEISMVRCGYGSNIELFQYQSPDQAKTLPKNSDIGGHHRYQIGVVVDDGTREINAISAGGRFQSRPRATTLPPGS
jgi:hypothetical protein